MKADKILNIPATNPELLFTAKDKVHSTYKELAKIWHPDKKTGDNDVFAHITMLYDKALLKLKNSYWDNGTKLTVTSDTGKKYIVRYRLKYEFELGTYYVGDHILVYQVRKEHSDLFDIAVQHMKPVFPNDKMSTEMGRFLPDLNTTFSTPEYRFMALNKTPDVVPLRWVVQRFKKVHPKQAAWMTSAILNICCGLQVVGKAHNDISLDSTFVSLKYHSALLLGGWWWSGSIGMRMKNVPKRTFQMLPTKIKTKKKHTIATSITCAKSTIREAMGSLSGPSLRTNKDIPTPFVDWLLSPSSNDAITTYNEWKTRVLPAMKYKREFVLWDVPQEELLK